jgi:hypothetical protein
MDATLTEANLQGAKNLTCEQLTQARNWQTTYRDTSLKCGAEIPVKEDGE